MTRTEQRILGELSDRLEAIHDMLANDAKTVQAAADAIRSGADVDVLHLVALDDVVVRHLRTVDEIAKLGDRGMLGRTTSGRVSELASERRPRKRRTPH